MRRKWWKNPAFFVIIILLAAGLPLLTNVILVISPNLTYHLLMRYQWVLYLILMTAFVERYTSEDGCTDVGSNGQHYWRRWYWYLIMEFRIISDIPIWRKNTRRPMRIVYVCWTGSSRRPDIIREFPLHWWVIGYDEFPLRILPGKVTDGMIGLSGDYLIYKGSGLSGIYAELSGATLNFLDPDTVGEIYMTQEYIDMDTFPGSECHQVVDGILYVKTENCGRD